MLFACLANYVPRTRLPIRESAAAALLLLSGCSSTREIVAERPRPAETAQVAAEPEQRTPVTLRMGTGDTPLPEEVASLRFRVEEVRFRREGGTWIAFPADVNAYDVRGGSRPERIVLTTELVPGRYDSLGIVLRDLFVQFGPASGAPLTLDPSLAYTVALPLEIRPDAPHAIGLSFETGASLVRAPDCRWLFTPFLTPTVGIPDDRP